MFRVGLMCLSPAVLLITACSSRQQIAAAEKEIGQFRDLMGSEQNLLEFIVYSE
jgi:hypothetical protein